MNYVEKKRTRLFGLPWTFTKYSMHEEKITIRSGFLNTVEDDTFLYKIQDVRLMRSLAERLAGTGTVICYTGDTTHPELKLEHIKHSVEVKEFLVKMSEEARLKRRTLHTIDVAHGNTDEFDDLQE